MTDGDGECSDIVHDNRGNYRGSGENSVVKIFLKNLSVQMA